MRTPSRLNILMCFLDVFFNSLLIFPARQLLISGFAIPIPGVGLGVAGAALGTAVSELITAFLMLYAVCFRSKSLRLEPHGSWRP